jgi:murein DD-endopeptidase MepM/ murein hydrolase activator NlpD
VYVVQEGDSLWAIAWRFGTTVEDLAAANAISSGAGIQPGMNLIIPGFEHVSGTVSTTDVRFGDTLSALSRESGVHETTLIALNHTVSPGQLYVGLPLITVTPPEGTPSAAVPVAWQEGQGILLEAASKGINPWNLIETDQATWRLWTPPGEALWYSGPAEGAPAADARPQFELRGLPGVQGRTTEVKVTSAEPIVAEGRLGDRTLHFHSAGEGLIALQGVHALTDPGMLDLEIELYRTGSETPFQSYSQPIYVTEGDYGRESLDVATETIDPANTVPEDQLVSELVAQVSPEKLWQGVFQFPASYYEKFPSVFGTRRSYNGSAYSYYHTGLDLYGSTTTPVLAPAAGRVVFAGPLTVRGNTTYIDHGWGVFSGFLHQSQLLVSVGDVVEPGQTIGMVGGTGRVTGPHLHWEIYVGGIPVDPIEWTTTVFP